MRITTVKHQTHKLQELHIAKHSSLTVVDTIACSLISFNVRVNIKRLILIGDFSPHHQQQSSETLNNGQVVAFLKREFIKSCAKL